MKTNVSESSLIAYEGMGYRNLAAIQQLVLQAIIEMGGQWVSRRQIASVSGLESSTVAGRCNELITAGRLEESESLMPCPITGRKVRMVRLPHKRAGVAA